MTPYLRKLLFVSIASGLFALTAHAAPAPGPWPLAMPRGTGVVLKIPSKAIAFEKMSIWTGAYSYTVNVEKSMTGLTVGGFPEWQNMGWASQLVLTLNKAEKKGGYLQVELDDSSGNHIKLRFMNSVTDIDGAMATLTFKGTLDQFKESDYYTKELASRFLPKVFTGPLAAIPLDKQLRLFSGVKYDLSSIEGETYKSKLFLVLKFYADDWIYNSNIMNPAKRVAGTFQRGLLTLIKGLHQVLAEDAPGIEGIKIEWKIFYREFGQDPPAPLNSDQMFIYSNRDQLAKFANDDITNQELIDSSVVLLNGDRVAVSLTQ